VSKTTPATYTPPSLTQYAAGEDILDTDALAVVQNAQHVWSRTGQRIPILVKNLNPFETTSSTYTQLDSGSERLDLTRLNPCFQLLRPVLVASVLKYQLIARAYGRDFVARLTLYSAAAGAIITTATITRVTGSGWGWSSATITIDPADVVVSGARRVLSLSLEVQRETTKAELWQVTAHEVVAAAAAYLPNGS
jgi:hypothetical protein